LGKRRVDRVQRRSVIAGLAVSLVVPQRLSAQLTTAKIPRVGILSPEESETAPKFDAFRMALRDLDYIEGRNIILEFRLAGGNLSRGPQLAAELAALPVDVIVAEGLVEAAVAASGHIPIVAPAVTDRCGGVSLPA
jgi:putative ABC transport system substrate-binding protein